MNLRQHRNQTSADIAQGKFVSRVLKEEGADINIAINNTMASAGFSSSFWQDKVFSVSGNSLEYRHTTIHRFVDIKTRKVGNTSIRKKRYPIHNKIIYGHLNNIARELMYGYTESVIDQMLNLEK